MPSNNAMSQLIAGQIGEKGGDGKPMPSPMPPLEPPAAAPIPEWATGQQPQPPAASPLNAFHGIQEGQGGAPADPMLAALMRFMPAGLSPGQFNIRPLQGRGFQ